MDVVTYVTACFLTTFINKYKLQPWILEYDTRNKYHLIEFSGPLCPFSVLCSAKDLMWWTIMRSL